MPKVICPQCHQEIADPQAAAVVAKGPGFWAPLKNAEGQMAAFFADHPKIKNFIDGALLAGLAGIVAFVKQAPNPAQVTYGAIGAAFMIAVKVYGQQALDSFLLSDATQTPKEALKRK